MLGRRVRQSHRSRRRAGSSPGDRDGGGLISTRLRCAVGLRLSSPLVGAYRFTFNDATLAYNLRPLPPTRASLALGTNGGMQLAFTNAEGMKFTVLASTNLTLPLSNWTVLAGVTEVAPGQFEFRDAAATNFPRRYYRLRTP